MARVRHVAVLIETSRSYGRGLLRGVARYNHEHEPWSIYFKPQGLAEQPPKWLRAWKGDGILARIDTPEMAETVLATRLPIVELRGRLPSLRLPFIGVDNRAVIRMALEHLQDRGLRQFAFCGLPKGEHRHMDERREFFVEAVAAAGSPCFVFEARQGKKKIVGWEEEQDQLAEWIRRLPAPVGVMTCNDDRGLQVLDACRRVNVTVPDQIAVVSVDNDEHLCSLATPPLTSIDVNPDRVGYEAAALLDALMSGGPAPAEAVLIPPRTIVTRFSSDILAVDDAKVVAAVRYIRDHACRGIGVEDVLRVVSLSRSVLERRFRSRLGRTPKAEIARVQIESAKRLLQETDLPLSTIAAKCGFNSLKYFSEFFHRKAGLTPSGYRRQTCVTPRA